MSENTEEVKQEKSEEPTRERERGNRGEVGQATSALKLKQKWHEQHFRRVDASDKHNPHKQAWVKMPNAPSLKQFARTLLAASDPVAIDWFDCKSGALEESRSKKNLDRIAEERRASYAARRKKSGGKSTSKADDSAAVATAALKKA